MKKITINDFSGGLQESVAPGDFSPRQWAQLKGIVPSSDVKFETQWPIQTVGTANNSGFQSVFPLAGDSGVFLVAIKTDGTIWWRKAPEASWTYTQSQSDAVTGEWTRVGEAAITDNGEESGEMYSTNYEYDITFTYAKRRVKILANPSLKFLCGVPTPVYKYVKNINDSELFNPAKDTDVSTETRKMASGVLINSTNRSSTNQVIIAYINTVGTPKVSAIVFPTLRRVPQHTKAERGFVKFRDANATTSDTVFTTLKDWFSGTGRFHPYTWVDQYGTLNPGTGVIPRANVGAVKGDKLILGDIEWRSDFADTTLPIPTAAAINGSTGTEFFGRNIAGASAQFIKYPTGSNIPTSARVIYNAGPGVVYLKDNNSIETEATSGGDVAFVKRVNNTTTLYMTTFPDNISVGDRIRVDLPGSATFDFDGTYTVTAVGDSETLGSPGVTYYKVQYVQSKPGCSMSYPTVIAQILFRKRVGSTVSLYINKTTLPTGFAAGSKIAVTIDGIVSTMESPIVNGIPTLFTISSIATETLSKAAGGDGKEYIRINYTNAGPAKSLYRTTLNETAWIQWGNASEDPTNTLTPGKVYTENVRNFGYKVEVGAYQIIPDSWGTVYVHASDESSKTRILFAPERSLATVSMTDDNTGPHRGSIYYAESTLDEFDPRSVLKPSKGNVRIAGLQVLDDTIVAITTAGTAGDGVLRIRGFLSKLHPYSGTADPTAVRIELIRGGVGSVDADTPYQHCYSCIWPEAGIVVFIDRLGGIFYTDGQTCDRLDRYGVQPTAMATANDHVAAIGKHLFAWRNNRLMLFTVMSSNERDGGSGCWTEMIMPSAGVQSMVGCREDVYFISNGKVMRIATAGPSAERGSIDNVPQDIIVSTPTIGSEDGHDRTNWYNFGMTFTTPSACSLERVTINSTGALSTGLGTLPHVQHVPISTSRSYSSPGVLCEFVVPAGIGPQAACSATVKFRGHVQLKSASFWISGREPRRGDL